MNLLILTLQISILLPFLRFLSHRRRYLSAWLRGRRRELDESDGFLILNCANATAFFIAARIGFKVFESSLKAELLDLEGTRCI